MSNFFKNFLNFVYAYIRGFFTAKGETVLILGGSRGIGWHLAKLWARMGAKVLVVARFTTLPEGCTGIIPGQVYHLARGLDLLQYDLIDSVRADWFMNKVLEFFDQKLPNHIFFNGGFSPEKEDSAHFEPVVRTNLLGNGKLMVMFAEQWRDMGEPACRLYVTSSYVTFMNLPNCMGYRATKAALESLAASLRVDFPGLLVYVINPGVVRTDIWGITGLVPWMKQGLLMIPGVSSSVEHCSAAIYWLARLRIFKRILPTLDAVLARHLPTLMNWIMSPVSRHGSELAKYQQWLARKWWHMRLFHRGLHWCLEKIGAWYMKRCAMLSV